MPIVYKGRKFSVEVDRVRFPNQSEHEIEVVHHPPSVVLLPMQDGEHVILIRQYRASIRRELWELPAGSLEPGETADAAAERECEEEIGLKRLEARPTATLCIDCKTLDEQREKQVAT